MPALAFFQPALLTKLYKLAPDNPVFLLMHHRAALFVCIFVASIWAAFHPNSRQLATIVVAISMVSFLLLYWRAGSPKALAKIARVDLIGLPALAYVGWNLFSYRL